MERLLNAIGKDMVEKIPELNKFFPQWPSGQEAMDMPCLSIIAVGTPAFTMRHHVGLNMAPSETEGKNLVRYITGDWEHKLQIDLWCEYKAQRELILQKIVDYFDSQFVSGDQPSGVRLSMPDYFDSIASYILKGYNYMDSEDSAKTSEWRVKFDVVCDSPKVVEKDEYVMKQFIVKNRVDEFVDVETDNTNEVKTF